MNVSKSLNLIGDSNLYYFVWHFFKLKLSMLSNELRNSLRVIVGI